MKNFLTVKVVAPNAFRIPIMFILSKIKTNRIETMFIDATIIIITKIAAIFLSNNLIHSKIE